MMDTRGIAVAQHGQQLWMHRILFKCWPLMSMGRDGMDTNSIREAIPISNDCSKSGQRLGLELSEMTEDDKKLEPDSTAACVQMICY
jgi:hypothetical protein